MEDTTEWYLMLVKFITADTTIKTSAINLPIKKGQLITISCNGHTIERRAHDLFLHYMKNDGKFSCYICNQKNGCVKSTQTGEKSCYVHVSISADAESVITDNTGEKWVNLILTYRDEKDSDNDVVITNYAVSDHGKTKNIKTNHIGNEETLGGGYKRVVFSMGSRKMKARKQIHTLVAIGFLGLENEQYSVNHIDGNPSNNHVDNLEWASMSENIRHKTNFSKKLQDLSPIDEEKWKTLSIDGINIELSNHGRIKTQGRITKGSKGVGNKYYDHKGYRVSRLIAQTFGILPKGDLKNYVVNHKDGNTENNHIDNLEWITHSENSYHATGLDTNTHCRPIQQMIGDKIIAKYPSIVSASQMTGISDTAIGICLSGSTNSSGGFLWNYIEGEPKIKKPWQDPDIPSEDFLEKELPHSKHIVKAELNVDGTMGKILDEYPSIKDASLDTEISESSIRRSIRGETKQIKYFWTYKDPKHYETTEADSKKAKGYTVQKINTAGEVVQTFKSIKESARESSVGENVMRKWIIKEMAVDGFKYIKICE